MSSRPAQRPAQEARLCPVCGRPFANRKRWRSRGQWEAVVYCSERCRRARRRSTRNGAPA